jgi:hypothetical protein
VLTKKEKIFSLMIEYGPIVRTEKKHQEKKIKNVTQLTVFGCNSSPGIQS